MFKIFVIVILASSGSTLGKSSSKTTYDSFAACEVVRTADESDQFSPAYLAKLLKGEIGEDVTVTSTCSPVANESGDD